MNFIDFIISIPLWFPQTRKSASLLKGITQSYFSPFETIMTILMNFRTACRQWRGVVVHGIDGENMAELLIPDDAGIAKAVTILRAGGLVAIPTETVYGLAADATNGQAVASIYEAKGRPSFNPLICHVSDMMMAEQIAVFDPLSAKLAAAFWPGPLTLILKSASSSLIHPLTMAGLTTVGVRIPEGPARVLIKRLGAPLAAPSANSSGRISATSAQAVNADLGAKIDLILDGGACPVGVESTIVKVEDGKLRLLRPGGVSADDLERVAGQAVVRVDQRAAIEAPGMLASHYAPRAKVRLDAMRILPDEALLAFGPRRVCGVQSAVKTLNLSVSANLKEAAANLFSYLNQLDIEGVRCIAVEPIPMTGLGEAINDRLMRASAPRDQGISHES
jgi:L-threonylcarbamoyladenylate synthase